LGILEWLENERRHVFLTVIILCLIPPIIPLKLPIKVESWTQDCYDTVQSLGPGDIAVMSSDIAGATVAELYPGFLAIAKQLQMQGVRVAFVTFAADGEIMLRQVVVDAGFVAAEAEGKRKYGEDYIVIPYIAGAESGYLQLARDTWSTFNKDIYGNPIESLPMMNDFHSFDDATFLAFASAVRPEPFIRQWGAWTPKLKIVIVGLSFFFSEYFVYTKSLQAVGFINGLKGAAEYEMISGITGKGLIFMDQASLTHVYCLSLLALGNFNMWKGVKRKYVSIIGEEDKGGSKS